MQYAASFFCIPRLAWAVHNDIGVFSSTVHALLIHRNEITHQHGEHTESISNTATASPNIAFRHLIIFLITLDMCAQFANVPCGVNQITHPHTNPRRVCVFSVE